MSSRSQEKLGCIGFEITFIFALPSSLETLSEKSQKLVIGLKS